MEVSGQLHALATFTTRERAPGTLWIVGWVGPRAVLAVFKIFFGGVKLFSSGSITV
jgi:hypothetical protein